MRLPAQHLRCFDHGCDTLRPLPLSMGWVILVLPWSRVAFRSRRFPSSAEKQMILRWFGLAFVGFLAVMRPASAQDAAAGEKVFAKCKVCHQIGPGAKNGVGPELNGVVGRKAGSVQGFNYSPQNKNSGLTWDEATLKDYLKNPRAKIPGTKMIFPGLQSEAEIDNVIAYLKQFGPDGNKS
jgi:cytochrome c